MNLLSSQECSRLARADSYLVAPSVFLDSYCSIIETKLMYTAIRLPLFTDASKLLLKCTDRTYRYHIRRRRLKHCDYQFILEILTRPYLTVILRKQPFIATFHICMETGFCTTTVCRGTMLNVVKLNLVVSIGQYT
jgi:hypothetical protein